MKKIKVVLILISCLMLSGCASTITANKLTSQNEETTSGIPYYLPQPYLLMTKNLALMEQVVETSETAGDEEGKKDRKRTSKTEIVAADKTEEDVYRFKILYLPDKSEKYGLKIKARTGTIKTNMTLVDGWQLTGVNLDADAKTKETIEAVATGLQNILSGIKDVGILSKTGLSAGMGEKLAATQKDVEAGLWLYRIDLKPGRDKNKKQKPMIDFTNPLVEWLSYREKS